MCHLMVLICKLKIIMHLHHYVIVRMKGEAMEKTPCKSRQRHQKEQGLKQTDPGEDLDTGFYSLISLSFGFLISTMDVEPPTSARNCQRRRLRHQPGSASQKPLSKCLHPLLDYTCELSLSTSISSRSVSSTKMHFLSQQ